MNDSVTKYDNETGEQFMVRVRQAKGQGTISASRAVLDSFDIPKDSHCLNIMGVLVIEEGKEEEVRKAMGLQLEEYNHKK